MQIKRYEVKSIQEALTRIKNDLGDNAVILSTKRMKGGKVPLLEITAARDESDTSLSFRESSENEESPNRMDALVWAITELTGSGGTLSYVM